MKKDCPTRRKEAGGGTEGGAPERQREQRAEVRHLKKEAEGAPAQEPENGDGKASAAKPTVFHKVGGLIREAAGPFRSL